LTRIIIDVRTDDALRDVIALLLRQRVTVHHLRNIKKVSKYSGEGKGMDIAVREGTSPLREVAYHMPSLQKIWKCHSMLWYC